MSRMTEAERAAVASETAEHNATVAADIAALVDQFKALTDELMIASQADAKLRDNLAEVHRTFKHQYDTLVRPHLPAPAEGAAEA